MWRPGAAAVCARDGEQEAGERRSRSCRGRSSRSARCFSAASSRALTPGGLEHDAGCTSTLSQGGGTCRSSSPCAQRCAARPAGPKRASTPAAGSARRSQRADPQVAQLRQRVLSSGTRWPAARPGRRAARRGPAPAPRGARRPAPPRWRRTCYRWRPTQVSPGSDRGRHRLAPLQRVRLRAGGVAVG